MRRQDLSFDLPELTFEQVRIVLTVPDFTLVNVEAQTKQTEQASKQLQSDVEREALNVSSKMRAELKTVTNQGISDLFSCNESSILSQRDAALLKLDEQISAAIGKAALARDQKAEDVARAIDAGVALMIKSRDEIVGQFQKAIDDLRQKRNDALTANAAN